jgi:hypothetical protein
VSPKNKNNFVDLSLQGEVLPDEIDDYVDIWYENESELKLSEFLGFTDEEYALWVEKPNYLKFILNARRNNQPISNYYDRSKMLQLAARDVNVEDIEELIAWLKRTGRIAD